MIDSLQKYLAELFGTFTLVFIGSVAIVSTRLQGASGFDVTVGLAFGLALLAGLFAFAELSGGHFNPVVSLAMVLDKRLDAKDLIPYWVYPLEGGATIERHLVALPMSPDMDRMAALRRTLALYRMVFGQSRQEDMIHFLLSQPSADEVNRLVDHLRIDLSPPRRATAGNSPEPGAEFTST